MGRIADLVGEYLSLVDNGKHRQALPPGASDEQINEASATLGFEIPADLVELLRIHNGGRIFDAYEWIVAAADGPGTLPYGYRYFMDETIQLLRDGGADLSFYSPGRYLQIAGLDRFWILYDIDVLPGRLLVSDPHSEAGIVPLARSLESLLASYVELATMGVMEWQGSWFTHGGDYEVIIQRLRGLGVTEAAASGVGTVPEFVNGPLPVEWSWAKPPAAR